MRAKICGITNLNDAQTAVQLGAWALGFNFYKPSPRYIEPNKARDIIEQLPSYILKIGIVIDTPDLELANFMETVGLDLIQVYADVDVIPALKKRMILSLQADNEQELLSHEKLSQYGYLLLDTPKSNDGLMGGTGRLCNWKLAAKLAQRYKLLLAGGLTPDNVQLAIETVKPYAVDVASGVQANPGKLDPSLLTQFLRQVNHAY